MQLLLERSQKKGAFRKPTFLLWAKYELVKSEQALVDQYDLGHYILVEGDPVQTWHRTIRLAGALAVLVFFLILFTASFEQGILSILTALIWALFTFVVAAFATYYRILETIKLKDILNGRHFACRSIVTLLEKEEQLADMAQTFTRFLEAVENWGGREVIEVAPDRALAARFVEKPHAGG